MTYDLLQLDNGCRPHFWLGRVISWCGVYRMLEEDFVR